MTPTAEQLAIVEAAKGTGDNLIIHALAGAAKTSTLVMIAQAMRSTPTLCLAFNVRIKDELKERLPPNCEAMTLNSVGHRTWGSAIGKRLVVTKDKTYQIVREAIEKLGPDRGTAYEFMSDLIRAIDSGKQNGWVPDGKFSTGKPLIDDEEFFATLDEEPSALFEDLCKTCMFESIAQAMQGVIDYNDQIYMPTVFHGNFRPYPLTLVDEYQDFSLLNHAMLRKMIKPGLMGKPGSRIIAVGDECQSIYGFRGAHQDSMTLGQDMFSMRRLDLSISFRCPRSVVREAHSRAPMMKWPDWAVEGTVTSPHEWNAESIPDGTTILCRNNAPLFAMAIRLIRNGKFPELVGNDIGKKLIKLMQKLGDEDTPRDTAYDLVDEWVAKKEKKSRDLSAVHDQAECMKVFIENGTTLGDAIVYAQSLLSRSGNIKMMTIHKAKGLEWHTVYLLDRQIIRVDKSTQERNLLYVAQTRAKHDLVYVRSDGFRGV